MPRISSIALAARHRSLCFELFSFLWNLTQEIRLSFVLDEYYGWVQ